jgi:hypothetical protein
VRGNLELGCKHLQHAFEIAENLVIPDTDHPVAERGQEGIAAPIGCAIGMLPAIDLG